MHVGADHPEPVDRTRRRLVAALASAATISGCSAAPRVPAPLDAGALAEIPGIPGARFWGDAPPEQPDVLLETLASQQARSGVAQEAVLAISGGADNGAFGAGLLNAWTDRGDRPEFVIVTGVSTGALSAPFAFLGASYDDALREVYGGLPPERIFVRRSLFGILRSNSVADDGPLAELIAAFVDDAFLADVAAEHRRGRRLFVQTTHLDAQRPVIWDMGRIAESDAPNAGAVFQQVLLASASVPGAFPPVLIEVSHDGRRFDELHVDGGVVSEFTTPEAWESTMDVISRAEGRRSDGAPPKLFLVRNGRVTPEPAATANSFFGVASRSLSTLLKFHGVGDMDRAFEVARDRGLAYRATWIRDDFSAPRPGPFQPAYMAALFDYGYRRMQNDDVWSDEPPDW